MMTLAVFPEKLTKLRGVRDCAREGPLRHNLPAEPTHQRCAPKVLEKIDPVPQAQAPT